MCAEIHCRATKKATLHCRSSFQIPTEQTPETIKKAVQNPRDSLVQLYLTLFCRLPNVHQTIPYQVPVPLLIPGLHWSHTLRWYFLSCTADFRNNSITSQRRISQFTKWEDALDAALWIFFTRDDIRLKRSSNVGHKRQMGMEEDHGCLDSNKLQSLIGELSSRYYRFIVSHVFFSPVFQLWSRSFMKRRTLCRLASPRVLTFWPGSTYCGSRSLQNISPAIAVVRDLQSDSWIEAS